MVEIAINGRRVDPDTAAVIQAATEEMDQVGYLSPAIEAKLEDRKTRAYITGDTGLVALLDAVLEQSYQHQQKQSR